LRAAVLPDQLQQESTRQRKLTLVEIRCECLDI
jgi:hypothetical protein